MYDVETAKTRPRAWNKNKLKEKKGKRKKSLKILYCFAFASFYLFILFIHVASVSHYRNFIGAMLIICKLLFLFPTAKRDKSLSTSCSIFITPRGSIFILTFYIHVI